MKARTYQYKTKNGKWGITVHINDIGFIFGTVIKSFPCQTPITYHWMRIDGEIRYDNQAVRFVAKYAQKIVARLIFILQHEYSRRLQGIMVEEKNQPEVDDYITLTCNHERMRR